MRPGEWEPQIKRANLRSWLEEAILLTEAATKPEDVLPRAEEDKLSGALEEAATIAKPTSVALTSSEPTTILKELPCQTEEDILCAWLEEPLLSEEAVTKSEELGPQTEEDDLWGGELEETITNTEFAADSEEPLAQKKDANLHDWLQEAILSSDAALSPNPLATEPKTEVLTMNGVDQTNGHTRKLTTVRTIKALFPLNKTHKLAIIDGWEVVVAKSRHFVGGELVVFFEVDAFLPARTEFESLFSQVGPMVSFNDEEGYRVGTSTWKDFSGHEVISQGYIFHLIDFEKIGLRVGRLRWDLCNTHNSDAFTEYIRGVDFSDMLGVKKWEYAKEETETICDSKSNGTAPATHPKPPSFVPKSSMERVQNCPNLFVKEKYEHFIFQESLKMDGASMTIYFIPSTSPYFSILPPLPSSAAATTYLRHATHPNGRFGVCSRNLDLLPHLLPTPLFPNLSLYWRAALDAGLHRLLPSLNQPILLQAELVGATIQGNPYSYPTAGDPKTMHTLFLFSISSPQTTTGPTAKCPLAAPWKRWTPRSVEAFASQHGLTHVPVLGYHTLREVARNHADLITRAELKYGEGLVFKNCHGGDGRWFKVLSNRWVLERGDEVLARAAAAASAAAKEEGMAGVGVDEKGVIGSGAGVGGKSGNKGKKKKNKINKKGPDVEDEAEMMKAKMEAFKGWQADPEVTGEIRRIGEKLEIWMERDDALREWMEVWERERASEKAKAAKAKEAASKQRVDFAVSKAKSKELADWLGL